MKLRSATSELAARFQLEVFQGDIEVTGAQLSSNLCRPGDLFIAVGGLKNHGIEFIDAAIAAGAVAVLTDSEHLPDSKIPTLLHPNPKAVAGAIADYLYQTSESGMQLFGVTGTNGKTSTVTYLQQILQASGVACGLSASTSRLIGNQEKSSSLTTPEVTELHRLLSEMRESGQQHAAIEVSAQAMVRHRVDGLRFDVVGFTNLSRDHLDDFGSMENYLAAKALLFTKKFSNHGVILVDDQYAQELADKSEIPTTLIGPGLDYQYSYDGNLLSITGRQQADFAFEGGALMAKNLVLAIVMLLEAGHKAANLQAAVLGAELKVPGRLERVSAGHPAIFVDYAHTPAGVASAVGELRSRYQNLTVVLGASGNRDQGKRPQMATAAGHANLLVITDQHPRDEDPAEIRKTLMKAASEVLDEDQLVEIADPEAAIRYAVQHTEKTGAVLWCGPGHLTYREVAGKKIPFDARSIASRLVSDD